MNSTSLSHFGFQTNKGYFIMNKETKKKSTSKKTKPSPQVIYTGKEQLIIDAEQTVLANIDNNGFTVSQMADMLWVSERKLQRHMKKIIDLGPWQFIRKMRMTYAYELVKSNQYSSLKRLAKEVGYRDLRSFKKHYMNQYGVWPEV